jgi:beta-phosphoglucomutase-like phosphatase (HAD superfamily)
MPKTTLISNLAFSYREHKKGKKHNLAWQQMAAQERILIESETKKLLLQEALFTTTMSKARAPKRKEEYVPPDKIEEFCKEILKAGRHLAVVSSPRFPDAERVSKAIEKVLMLSKNTS